MPYTPTGRPVGRPKTKDYKTISLKIPQDLLDRVQRYARRHKQPLSQVFRDGVTTLLGGGSPDHDDTGNTEIHDTLLGELGPPGVLQDILTTLARQEGQLHALAQALEQRVVAVPSPEYSGNTSHEATPPHSPPAPAVQRKRRRAVQEQEPESITVLPDKAPVRRTGRPRTPEGEAILTLLAEHPQGLTAKQLKVYLEDEKGIISGKPIGDTLSGMKKTGIVIARGPRQALRYILASAPEGASDARHELRKRRTR